MLTSTSYVGCPISSAAPPLSIAHILQPVTDGVATTVLALASAQKERGHDVTVLCPESAFAASIRARGLSQLTWQAGREPGLAVVSESIRLRGILQGRRLDVVHLHSAKAGLAGRLAVRGRLPTVYQPHAWSFNAVDGRLGAAAQRWERWACRWTSLTICVSAEELAEGRRAGVTGLARVVPNGVNPAVFPVASEPDKAAARQRLGLPASVAIALLTGRLCRQKGQDVAIAAWPDVRKRLPGAELLLVGTGPDEAHLASQVGVAHGVRFLGVRADVPELLAACDVVLQPSRWEGMALTVLEAMSAGRPVVATGAAGNPSALTGGGLPDAGLIVPVNDPAALGDAVVKIINEPGRKQDLGQAGRARVLGSHDATHQNSSVLECYSVAMRAHRFATQRPPGPRRVR